MLDGLYWENYYNNQNVSEDERGYIYYENKLLGVPRLRQLRVKDGSCDVCWLQMVTLIDTFHLHQTVLTLCVYRAF